MRSQLFQKSGSAILLLILVASQMGATGFTGAPFSPLESRKPAQALLVVDGQIAAADLEAFTDELVTRQLNEYHIAGASVSIVQDGKIELSKGYGYADIEKGTPVNPHETIFRIGSISKLFTWTAVMQLAEQGKIDLAADVNRYLPDFQIPATYPTPVSMLSLLSHTAGFEERATAIESRGPDEMISLHDYLANYMPDRVRPAGELITYSNYGAALAGYIVEVVSGMPFEQYVETYLYKPLDMPHSTFRQLLPTHLAGHLATSYAYNGGFVPGSFSYLNLRPAGAMASTADDMAHFMIAHLQGGKLGNNQLLKPETVNQMQSQLFSNDERLDGMAYGFMEWNFNGKRTLWHTGDIGNWHSGLAIIPEEKLGFFVSYNSNEGYRAVNDFYSYFMKTFFPAPAAGDPPAGETPTRATEDLAGEYRSTRSCYNHVERIAQFPGNGNLVVTANADGTISLAGQIFYQKEPLVYSPPDGSDTLIFRRVGDGKIMHFFVNSNQLFAYERVPWYGTSTFNMAAFGVGYALLLTAFLAACIGIFRRQKDVNSTSRLARIARVWAFIVATVFLLVPIAMISFTAGNYKYPFPAYMVIVLAAILAASILVTGPVIFTVLAWVRRYWSLAGRIHYTFITIALLGMVWLMYYWRLLGFRY